jgi:ATP-dependent Lhr-like helicase
LVSRGLVTGDGMAGLRTLLLPPQRRRSPQQRLRVIKGGASPGRLMPVGRWSLLRRPSEFASLDPPIVSPPAAHWVQRPSLSPVAPYQHGEQEGSTEAQDSTVALARQYLHRYGIVTREVLLRETFFPGWRSLLKLFWKMEAQGEIRGGRFVAGFAGEQFALPEAIETLRALRRQPPEKNRITIVASADPLNLVGILTPGERVSPFSSQVIAYEHGIPLEIGELGQVLSRLQGKRSSEG